MPPPVRRKTFVLVFVLGAALALASVAYAGNGGFAPLTPHSPNARRINDAYVWISIFTGTVDAIPADRTPAWVKADQLGSCRGRCRELCGVCHAAMRAVVDVQPRAGYKAWLNTAAGELGRSEWQ